MKKKINSSLLLMTIGIFFFIVAFFLLMNDQASIIDTYIYNSISHMISENVTGILIVITNIMSVVGIVLLSLIILFILYKNKKIQQFYIFLMTLGGGALTLYLFKNFFKRIRPDIIRLIPIEGYSFPSGHSFFSMMVYGYLIYLIDKYFKNKFKHVLIVILTLMILITGFSRIYLGVHYFSDVIAGFSLGLIFLSFNFIKNK